jgi:Protein phosphatase 2C
MSADASKSAAPQTPGGWLALTATHRGAAHQMNGMPNQDAVAVRQIQPDGLVTAIADGHGHHRHFRSARGSELAVAIAGQVAEELAARLDDFEAAGQIEADVLSTLVPAITGRWRAAARDDLAGEPFTIAEEEARAFADDVLIAYGTTLLLAITWRNWLVLTQIGDGDIVCIRPDGRALLPVPGDPSLDGRQTTSLCGPRAEQEFRAAVVNTAITPLLGVLLATDGYGNAQVAEPWADAVSSDLAERLGDSQPEWLAEQLPLWASHCASTDGSGDDTTIALLIAPSAAALRQEETRRQQQATVPPADEFPAAATPATAESAVLAVVDTPAPGEDRLAKSASGRAEAPPAAGGDVAAPQPAAPGGDVDAPGPAPAGRRRRIIGGLRPGRRGGGGAGGD